MFDLRSSEYDEIQRAVGLCHQVWSTVEQQLASLYAILADLPIGKDGTFTVHLPHPTLHGFVLIRSFETRLALLDTYFLHRGTLHNDACDAWKILKERLKRENKKRDQCAHFIISKVWKGKIGKSDYEIRLFPFSHVLSEYKPNSGLTSSQLKDRAIKFNETKNAIGKLGDYILIDRGHVPLDPESYQHIEHLLDF